MNQLLWLLAKFTKKEKTNSFFTLHTFKVDKKASL